MRIAFTNNYPLNEARRLCAAGLYPAQHLWGSDALERAGHLLTYIDVRARDLDPLTRITRNAFGDFRAQGRVSSLRPDLLCCGDQGTLRALAAMRGLRLGHPLVVVYHHTPARRQLARLTTRGIDEVVCLSRHLRDSLVSSWGRSPAHTHLLPWGPDLAFAGYDKPPADDGFVVSAGKTNRDNLTLARAVTQAGVTARIYGDPVHDGPGISWTPGYVPFAGVLPDLRAAAVFAVCLADPARFSGLSELNDALALGRPIVMTRTPTIDVDLEDIGCGVWVDAGDVDGWAKALATLIADPAMRREMGGRGRRFAEEHWNAELFGRGLVEVVAGV